MMDYRGYDVIYADSEEKYVKSVILYGKTSDNFVHTTSKMTENDKVDKDTLLELLKKGVIIKYNDDFYTPIFFSDESTDESTHASLTIATAISASASSAVVLNSKEYSAD